MSARFKLSVSALVPWLLSALWFAGWHIWHTLDTWSAPRWLVPGPMGDNTVMLWNLGWIRHIISQGDAGFWFPNAYYPTGFFFLFGTHTWLDGVLAWMASPLLPKDFTASILFANFNLLFATVATGLLAISALAAWKVAAWPIRICVASAVTFCWFRMFAISGHYHFYGTHWMLSSLTLASWSRYWLLSGDESRALKFRFGAGALLGITFLNDQTMFVFAAILMIPICCSGGGGARGIVCRLLTVYATALIPASIHLVAIVNAMAQGGLTYRVDNWNPRLVDASSLLLPPDRHFLGPVLQPLREHYGLTWSEGTYVGLVPIVLLLVAMVYGVRNRVGGGSIGKTCLISGVLAVVFLVVALGDRLLIGRLQVGYLPELLIKKIPILNAIRLPQRWVWPAQFCIACGGGLALQQIWNSGRGRGWLQAALLIFACVPGIEGQSFPRPAPVDYRDQDFLLPPKLIGAVKEHYTDGGVLAMPVERAIAHNNILQFAWGYEIPITLAYTARMPVNPKGLPWKDNQWTAQTGQWLQDHRVGMIVFPYDTDLAEYGDWLHHARIALPDLKIVSRDGLTTTVF